MAATAVKTFTPDTVVEIQLRPGTLEAFRESLAEGGPRIKCYKGSLTFVFPGETHGKSESRLGQLIVAVCMAVKIPLSALSSTYFGLPGGGKDSGFEPDESY